MLSWSEVSFPEAGKVAHTVTSSREEGELFLSRLAMVSRREYVWEYDGANSEWKFVPAKAYEQKKRRFGFGKVVYYEHGLEFPDQLTTPSGDNSTLYHIHPSAHFFSPELGDLAQRAVLNQFPSKPDLEGTIENSLNGYVDSRIVTELGVTSLRYYNELVEWKDGKIMLAGTDIEGREIDLLMQNYGVLDTIEEVFAHMNDSFDGVIEFRFDKI